MASEFLVQNVDNSTLRPLTDCIQFDGCNENINEWNNLKDKNDNLELDTGPGNTAEKVCRTCFNIIEADSYLKIYALENSGYLENLINMCLPRLNLLLTKDPIVCDTCYSKLEDFCCFSTECMKTENELINYCSSKHISSPINISDFLEHKLKQRTDFVIVKQEDSHLNSVSITEIISPDNINNLDTSSNYLDVKSEDEEVDFIPTEENNTNNKSRKPLRKTKKKYLKTMKIGLGSKILHSKDLLEIQVKCEKCDQKFTSKWALDRHTPIHNMTNAIYTCETCNIKFKYKHSYDKHITAHLTGAPVTKPFACECGKYFNRKAKLKKHQEIHVKREKPFSCKSCGKRFIDEKLLEGHIERVHTSEKAFGCELCGNKYTSKAGLDVHYKTHFPGENPRPEPDLMCDVCGKLFHRKYSLEKHRMSHTGDKPHECEECSMKFKERYQLTIHMRRHTGEKPFKCEVCDFKFPSKNRLGVHMRIHTGVRPFPCQLCNMAFTRNDHLIKHVRAIHTGERPFECDICTKTFNRKDYLLKHKRVHFKRPL